jgi:hypothetical protein
MKKPKTKDRQQQTEAALRGYIERHAVVSSILTIARARGLVNAVSVKLVQMLDLPGGFFADNSQQTVEWWLKFALDYDHSVDYGPIRLKYYEGDPTKLEMPRHTSL